MIFAEIEEIGGRRDLLFLDASAYQFSDYAVSDVVVFWEVAIYFRVWGGEAAVISCIYHHRVFLITLHEHILNLLRLHQLQLLRVQNQPQHHHKPILRFLSILSPTINLDFLLCHPYKLVKFFLCF